jgi:hypothetical protein
LKTIREHAAFVSQRLSLHSGDAVRTLSNVLQLSVRAGLLVSRRRLEDLFLQPGPIPFTGNRVEFLCIPTKNRPSCLKRVLHSYLGNCRQFGRSVQVVIADDTDDAGMERQNAATVEETRVEFGMPVWRIRAEDRRKYVVALAAETGVDPATVAFALIKEETTPVSVGCMRNATLLHAAGSLLVSVDDDTVCRMGAVPNPRGGVCLSSALDPTEFWFYPDRITALEETSFVDGDFLAEHERILGKTADHIIEESGGPLNFDFSGGGPAAMLSGEISRWPVAVTSLGLLGDSGMADNSYFAIAGGESRSRLARVQSDGQELPASREIRRCVRQTTLNVGPFCMATNLGLDQRQLLPPFFPLFRNQDALFALTLRACSIKALFGFLPLTLAHLPEFPRRPSGASSPASGITAPDAIGWMISHFQWPSAAGPGGAMRELGQHLSDIGDSAPDEFRSFVGGVIRREIGSFLIVLDRLIGAASADGSSAHLKERAAALRRDLTSIRSWRVLDFPDRSAEDGYAVLQRLCSRFGQLLQCWPELLQGALRLRARGITLGRDW